MERSHAGAGGAGADPSAAPPEIFWVVGPGTEVGKTTVATALIRTLNRLGVPAAGFKPIAGSVLMDSVDLLLQNPPGESCGLIGEDGLNLAKASPLTGADMADVVGPAQAVSFPRFGRFFLARWGSARLGTLEYVRGGDLGWLAERPDVARFLARIGVPMAGLRPVESLGYETATYLAADKQEAAFRHLVDLGARAVVCEGAGALLPVWRNGPLPRHLVLASGGAVHLYPGINLDIRFDPGRRLPTIRDLRAMLTLSRRAKVSAPLPLAPFAEQAATADRVVEGLLRRAGLG